MRNIEPKNNRYCDFNKEAYSVNKGLRKEGLCKNKTKQKKSL